MSNLPFIRKDDILTCSNGHEIARAKADVATWREFDIDKIDPLVDGKPKRCPTCGAHFFQAKVEKLFPLRNDDGSLVQPENWVKRSIGYRVWIKDRGEVESVEPPAKLSNWRDDLQRLADEHPELVEAYLNQTEFRQ